MSVALVVAMDRTGLIGAGGALPWHLPADLRRFRALTTGHPIVMGRRTHESIGRPLPDRHNIVVTRRHGYLAPGCTVVADLPSAYLAAGDVDEIMVIGGAALYRDALPDARRLYLTEVHATLAGDVYFPSFDRRQWHERVREDHPADERNRYRYSFVVLDRLEPAP